MTILDFAMVLINVSMLVLAISIGYRLAKQFENDRK